MFIELRNKLNSNTKIIIQILFVEHNNIDERYEKWKRQFKGLKEGYYRNGIKDYSQLTGDLFRKGKLHNYGEGKDFIENITQKYKPCYWPMQIMAINSTV